MEDSAGLIGLSAWDRSRFTPEGRPPVGSRNPTMAYAWSQEITHPVFGYQISYRGCSEVQARLRRALSARGLLPQSAIHNTARYAPSLPEVTDICDANVFGVLFKTMKALARISQFSVFQCDLPDVMWVRMKAALTEIIDQSVKIRCSIVDPQGPTESRACATAADRVHGHQAEMGRATGASRRCRSSADESKGKAPVMPCYGRQHSATDKLK